jgi:hypothetical protein
MPYIQSSQYMQAMEISILEDCSIVSIVEEEFYRAFAILMCILFHQIQHVKLLHA